MMRLAALLLLLAVSVAAADPTLQDLTPGDKTAYVQLSEAPTLTDNVYTIRQTVGSSTQFIESGSVPFATGSRTATVTYKSQNMSPGNYTFTLLLGGTGNNTTWTINEAKAFSIVAPVPTPTPRGSQVEIFVTSPSSGKRLDLSKDVTVSGTASHNSGIDKVWISFHRGGGVTCTENKAWEGPITGKESWTYEWGLKSDAALGEVWDSGKYSILVKAKAVDGTTGCIEVYPFPVFAEAQNLTPTPTPTPVDANPVDHYCDESHCVVSFDAATNGSACWEDQVTQASGPCPIKGEVVPVGKTYDSKTLEPGKRWCVSIKEGGKKSCTDAVVQRSSGGASAGRGCSPAPYLDQNGNQVQTFALQRNNKNFVYTPKWSQGDAVTCSFNANYRYIVTSVPAGVIYDTARLLDAKRSDHFNFTIPTDSLEITIEGSVTDQPGSVVTLMPATEVNSRSSVVGLLQNQYLGAIVVAVALVLVSYRPKLFIPNEDEPSEPLEVGGATPVLTYEINGRNYQAFLAPFYARKVPIPFTSRWTLAVMELPSGRKQINPTKGRLFRNIYTMPTDVKKGRTLYPQVHDSKDGGKHFYNFPGYNGHEWRYIFAGQPGTQPDEVEVDMNMYIKNTPEEQTDAKMRRLARRGEELNPPSRPAPRPAEPPPAKPADSYDPNVR